MIIRAALLDELHVDTSGMSADDGFTEASRQPRGR